MVLAVAGGSDLLQRTQQVFFQKKQNQVSKVGGKKGEGRGGKREGEGRGKEERRGGERGGERGEREGDLVNVLLEHSLIPCTCPPALTTSVLILAVTLLKSL